MNSLESSLESVIKALEGAPLTGLTGAVATKYLFSDSELLYPIAGINVPVYILSGITTGLGSILGEKVKDMVIKDFPLGDKLAAGQEVENQLISPVITGLINAGLYYVIGVRNLNGLIYPFLVAAGSEFLANTIESKYIDKYDNLN